MKPTPEASDYRTIAEKTLRQAEKLPPGPEKQSLLEKAGDYEAQARSKDWCHSHLHAPD